MNNLFTRAIEPIVSDPITLALLALLVVALIIASAAGKRAQAADKVRQRLHRVRSLGGGDADFQFGKAHFVDPMDEFVDKPSLATQLLKSISPFVSQIPLVGEKDRVKLQKTLVIAGYRSNEALNLMLTAKLLCGLLVGMVVYTGVVSGAEPIATGMRAFLSLPIGIVFGAMAPEFFVKWRAKKRCRRISQAIPDALDLMVICAEAGLTLETALHRVSREMRTATPELALELATTEAELKVLPERRMALENLVYRTDAPEIASLAVTMNQAEKYGTSLSQALRTIASEGRRTRMLRIEEKAARLPALMSLPLMVFVLPPCAVIVGGPAMVRLMGALSS